MKTLGFIGGGRLALSLIRGLISSGYAKEQIQVSDPNEEQRAYLETQFGISVFAEDSAILENAEVLILAVQPKDLEAVLKALGQRWSPTSKPLVLSLAAGISTAVLQRWCGQTLGIVRALPNTPALLCAGATGLYANPKVSEEQKALAESLLRAVGTTVWLNHEHDRDTVAALSSPAYFFLVMEALSSAAERCGLSRAVSTILTLQTALGAARMAIESDLPLTTLLEQARSPTGPTVEALALLEKNGLRRLFDEALHAAQAQARTLAQEFE